MRWRFRDPEQMLLGRTVSGVAEQAVDPIESCVSGGRELLKLVALYAVAFSLWFDQVGQWGKVCCVAGEALAFENRIMNLASGDWMLDLFVAGYAELFRIRVYGLGFLGGMTFRADILVPFGVSIGALRRTSSAATVAECVRQQTAVACEMRVVTGDAAFECGFDVVWASENLRLVVTAQAYVSCGLFQQTLVFRRVR
jgi:hypothetical protein